jgi:heparin binding hemagglutinin HbhA
MRPAKKFPTPKEKIMPTGGRIKKTLTDPRPLYAVAGASNLAMEKLRPRLAALRHCLEPTALQQRARDRADTLRHDLQALPDKAAEAYDDLAERGKTTVSRIRPTTEEPAKQTQKTQRGSTARKRTAGSTARKRTAGSTARKRSGE